MKHIHCVILLLGLLCKGNCVLSQGVPYFRISDEIKASIKLHVEALIIMDSLSEKVWPDWKLTNKVTYFFGAPGNNAVFINPNFQVPDGFFAYTDIDSDQKIYIRENSNMFEPVGGIEVALDGTSYKASSIMPYSIDTIMYNYYLSELKNITGNKEFTEKISDFIQSPEYYISIIFHETFHFYQSKKEFRGNYNGNIDKYYQRPRVRTLSYIEGMLLQRAFYADTDIELTDCVHQFLTVRYRKNKYSRRASQYEKEDEFSEGTAQYVEFKLLELLNDLRYEPTRIKKNEFGYFSGNSHHDLSLYDSLYMVASIRNNNYPVSKDYFYGCTQAKILDKLCGDTWKNEIMENGVYLTDLLSKYSNYDKKQSRKFLQKTLTFYAYKDLLKFVKQAQSTGNTIIHNTEIEIEK